MNSDLQNLTPKVEDGGSTPQGRLTASEWNILLEAVKLLDRTSGEIDTSEVLRIVRDAGYATQDWVNELIAGISTPDSYVSIAGYQQITGVKDFLNGLKIGGAPITYDAATQSFFFEGNIVLSGGVAIRAALGALDVPTIMDALRVDDSNLKVIDGVLTFVGQTGGGGIDEDFLSDYLSDNRYTTQDWVLSQRYLTGISSSMVTDALGYTPLSTGGGTVNGSINISGGRDLVLRASESNVNDPGDVIFEKSDGSELARIYYGGEAGLRLRHPAHGDGVLVNSVNIGDYALSLSGGTVNGNLNVRGLSCDNLNIYSTTSINPLSVAGNNRSGFIGIGSYSNGVYSRYGLISFPYENGSLYRYDNSYNAFEILDSNNIGSYNAGSATKLQTPITIWGQSFDGTGDINGNIYFSAGGNWKIGTPYEVNHKVLCNYINFGSNANGIEYVSGTWTGAWDLVVHRFVTNHSDHAIAIINNGNIAIGASIADEKFHVHGNIVASGDVTMRYTSDRRLKKNFANINASEILMSLGEVQSFEYVDSEVEKNHRYAGRHIGLMYQNVVGTALDRMCHEREDGYGSLNYIDTSYLALLGGVGQEHELRLRAQDIEIKDLRRENNELKRRINRLERMV